MRKAIAAALWLGLSVLSAGEMAQRLMAADSAK